MKIQAKPLSEITQQTTHILYREMGVAHTIRFLNQFTMGYGDYIEEREQWLKDLSLEDIVSEIKQMRRH